MRRILNDESGSVLLVVLLLTAVLTLSAIIASNSTLTELMVAGNSKMSRQAFFAAESGIVKAAATPTLYGSANVDSAAPLSTQVQPAGSQLDFNMTITYQGYGLTSNLMRHTGFSAGKFRAHEYLVDSEGIGPGTARANIKARFYRLGF